MKAADVRSEFSKLRDVCASISQKLAKAHGFVPVRDLLHRFDAQIIIRPLLVEGMLAKIARDHDRAGPEQWAVLIDNKSTGLRQEDIAAETAEKPLNVRARFTIAHELVHSMVYRPTHFGLEFPRIEQDKRQRDSLVELVEKETDRLTPLLLWPRDSVRDYLLSDVAPLSVESLSRQAKRLGISRMTLVSRLESFREEEDPDGVLQMANCRNTGVGIGEWTKEGAVLLSWPLFRNFHKNIVPMIFHAVAKEDRVPADSAIDSSQLLICGGSLDHVTLTTLAGTSRMPTAEKCEVLVEVEASKRAQNAKFLYLVRRVDL